MRISIVGSTPFPLRREQTGTCIVLEPGNGQRFCFDFGSGCMRNIVAMQMPIGVISDVFLTHLHVDHDADLPYMSPFTATMGLRFKPLRVTGPPGRTPELGTKAMAENIEKMLKWHLEEFDGGPVGDGFEVEVNEFDFRKENDICIIKAASQLATGRVRTQRTQIVTLGQIVAIGARNAVNADAPGEKFERCVPRRS